MTVRVTDPRLQMQQFSTQLGPLLHQYLIHYLTVVCLDVTNIFAILTTALGPLDVCTPRLLQANVAVLGSLALSQLTVRHPYFWYVDV